MASFQSRTQDEYLAGVIQKGKLGYLDLGEAEKLASGSWMHQSLLVADNLLRLGGEGIL